MRAVTGSLDILVAIADVDSPYSPAGNGQPGFPQEKPDEAAVRSGRRAQALRSGLLELEAVPQRVERVETAYPWQLVIRARCLVPRQPQRSFKGIEILHDKRRVCHPGSSKVRPDAEAKNGGTSGEPASTTRRERRGLG